MGVLRLMLYTEPGGTYVFHYECQEDGPCTFDSWFESPQEAEEYCLEEFAVEVIDWTEIPDPEPGCQHDWISPTRVKRDDDGNPLWGHFEHVDG